METGNIGLCLAAMMAQTSFWSYILSPSSLIKSLCYFRARSPFFTHSQTMCLTFLFCPSGTFIRHIEEADGKMCQLTPSPGLVCFVSFFFCRLIMQLLLFPRCLAFRHRKPILFTLVAFTVNCSR